MMGELGVVTFIPKPSWMLLLAAKKDASNFKVENQFYRKSYSLKDEIFVFNEDVELIDDYERIIHEDLTSGGQIQDTSTGLVR